MSSVIEQLFAPRDQLPPLSPKQPWRADLTAQIDALKSSSPLMGIAALHLLNDDIDNAHKLAQDHENESTSNLVRIDHRQIHADDLQIHAALHRREPDYWNSKYWIARVPSDQIKAVYDSRAAANAFVDAVEQAEDRKDASAIDGLRREQWDQLLAIARLSLGETAPK